MICDHRHVGDHHGDPGDHGGRAIFLLLLNVCVIKKMENGR